MTDRDRLLDDLAAAWSAWDPMPPDLPDRILTAVAMDGLDAAYELLTLVGRSDSLLGARSAGDDRTLIEFTANGVHVLVRVAEDESGRRIDGWVEPGRLESVTLTVNDVSFPGRLTSASRFSTEGLPAGLAALELRLVDGARERRFRSPHFEI